MQDKLIAAHLVQRTLHVDTYYPEHGPRTDTPGYEKVHHRLVVDEDTPCWICGARHSQGSRNETHHNILEWAMAQAADAEKLRRDFPDIPVHDHDALTAWVDHSQEQMKVLCPEHHRHVLVGVHMIPYPEWESQRYVTDEFLNKWYEKMGIQRIGGAKA